MKLIIPFYVTSAFLALIGLPMVLILIYLDIIDAGLAGSQFMWVASVTCCVLSILFFSLGRILAIWAEEGEQE